ncbi:sensor domain-containing protein [Methanolobus sp. ZRKC3]|uniref:sensor domain-containing protein n=1 Tax=Methanolobus sp. ZRKC3 TaxID=3125786 RepID=UPI00324A7084
MFDNNSSIHRFINVAFKRQTYLNTLYLLFTFPLGTAYFVFLVTGLSLGFTLSIVWLGIPILILVFLAWWEIASFERQLAIWFLDVEISPMIIEEVHGKSILEKGIMRLKNPVTWKGLLFLIIKFPFGILSLVVTVVLISLSLSLLFAPLAYLLGNVSGIDAMWEAIAIFALGIIVSFLSMHVMNFLAYLAGKLAVLLLGSSAEISSKIPNTVEWDVTNH